MCRIPDQEHAPPVPWLGCEQGRISAEMDRRVVRQVRQHILRERTVNWLDSRRATSARVLAKQPTTPFPHGSPMTAYTCPPGIGNRPSVVPRDPR